MTEIVKIWTAEIRLQDCMEYMRGLPDKAFDLAIVDPPYRDENKNQPTQSMRIFPGRMNKFGKNQALNILMS